MGTWIGVGSRIADAARAWQAAQDNPVINWNKSNEFIIAIAILNDAHLGDTDSFRVEYQDKTDVSGFIALPAAASELIQGTATVLVNGNPVTAAQKGCNGTGGFEEEAGQLEGDNETPAITISQDGWCEVQCAVDPVGAQDGHEYEFRLHMVTDAKNYLALATMTMAVAATPAWFDIPTRFKLTVQAFKDIATRFKLWIQNYKDTATRFILTAQAFQDIAARFKLTIQNYKDIATRFNLIAQGYKDIATRFIVSAGTLAYKDIGTRFKLWVQGFKDIAARFRLAVQGYQDIATRFRLIIQGFQDIATRFILRAQGFQDIATRFRLAVQGYQDIATRFLLIVQGYRDVATRFRLAFVGYKDVSTRFFLYVPTWKELQIQAEIADIQGQLALASRRGYHL